MSKYAESWHEEDKQSTAAGNEEQSEHYFNSIQFYMLKDGLKELHMDASELSYLNLQGKMIFFNPEGEVYNANGVPVNYKAKRGLYQEGQNRLHLEEEAYFRQQTTEMWADKVDFLMKKDYVSAQGNVKTKNIDENTKDLLTITSHQFVGHPDEGTIDYIGDVKGHIKRARVYEPNVYFESMRLLGNRHRSQLELRENVKVVRQGVTATSRNGEIFLENYNKKLKYFVLSDDVKVREKVSPPDGSPPFVREAYGEKLEGLTSEGKLILTGLPKVLQQGDTIRGNRIIIKENNQVVEVDDSNTNFIIR